MEFSIPALPDPDPSTVPLGGTPVQTTGRFIVVFARGADAKATLARTAGVGTVADSRDFTAQAVDFSQTDGSDAVWFDALGVAVVTAEPAQLGALRTAEAGEDAIISVSPELIHHILDGDYLQGYRDGVSDLAGRLGAVERPAGSGALAAAAANPPFADNAQFTWGLQATGVSTSPQSGAGIKVAVLDTGFDVGHPDFVGRSVTTQSFVAGETVQDGHGHGTHCIGTSCGSKAPESGPRYGVAYGASIYAGKVLGDSGSGSDGGIIAGINWAVENGCHVISMSLGADVASVHPPYTVVGQRALDAGSLIVAAAGNNADRRVGNFGFVGTPANSPFIMAVGALDQKLDMAYFSARTLAGTRGGQVDIAGPGYQVYSSWLMPTRYKTISGTSMATPHVAGVAALWAELTGYRGRDLWATLAQDSQRLLQPSVDVGGGLVLAPQ
ncbi:MAG TPA: S8 family serine peptidase [Nakamurella multipartita]|nr:S8 family serine peptidase [Nakamurella multipartita]